MELKEIRKTDGPYFPQREFKLLDDGKVVCKLMAMEIAEQSRADLTVITIPEYQRKGYATTGLKMLIRWAAENGYKIVTLTNLFKSEAIDEIAKQLYFTKDRKTGTWSKSLVGPLNL